MCQEKGGFPGCSEWSVCLHTWHWHDIDRMICLSVHMTLTKWVLEILFLNMQVSLVSKGSFTYKNWESLHTTCAECNAVCVLLNMYIQRVSNTIQKYHPWTQTRKLGVAPHCINMCFIHFTYSVTCMKQIAWLIELWGHLSLHYMLEIRSIYKVLI